MAIKGQNTRWKRTSFCCLALISSLWISVSAFVPQKQTIRPLCSRTSDDYCQWTISTSSTLSSSLVTTTSSTSKSRAFNTQLDAFFSRGRSTEEVGDDNNCDDDDDDDSNDNDDVSVSQKGGILKRCKRTSKNVAHWIKAKASFSWRKRNKFLGATAFASMGMNAMGMNSFHHHHHNHHHQSSVVVHAASSTLRAPTERPMRKGAEVKSPMQKALESAQEERRREEGDEYQRHDQQALEIGHRKGPEAEQKFRDAFLAKKKAQKKEDMDRRQAMKENFVYKGMNPFCDPEAIRLLVLDKEGVDLNEIDETEQRVLLDANEAEVENMLAMARFVNRCEVKEALDRGEQNIVDFARKRAFETDSRYRLREIRKLAEEYDIWIDKYPELYDNEEMLVPVIDMKAVKQRKKQEEAAMKAEARAKAAEAKERIKAEKQAAKAAERQAKEAAKAKEAAEKQQAIETARKQKELAEIAERRWKEREEQQKANSAGVAGAAVGAAVGTAGAAVGVVGAAAGAAGTAGAGAVMDTATSIAEATTATTTTTSEVIAGDMLTEADGLTEEATEEAEIADTLVDPFGEDEEELTKTVVVPGTKGSVIPSRAIALTGVAFTFAYVTQKSKLGRSELKNVMEKWLPNRGEKDVFDVDARVDDDDDEEEEEEEEDEDEYEYYEDDDEESLDDFLDPAATEPKPPAPAPVVTRAPPKPAPVPQAKPAPAPVEKPAKKRGIRNLFSKKTNTREIDLSNLVAPDAEAPALATLLAKLCSYGAPGRFPSVAALPGDMPFAGGEFDFESAKTQLIETRQDAAIDLETSAEVFACVVNCMLIEVVDWAATFLKKDETVAWDNINVVLQFMNHAGSLFDSVAAGTPITPVVYEGSLSKSKLEQMFSIYSISLPNMGKYNEDSVDILRTVLGITEKKAESLITRNLQKNMMNAMKDPEAMGEMMKGMGMDPDQLAQGMGEMGMDPSMLDPSMLGAGANPENVSPDQLKSVLTSLKMMIDSGQVGQAEVDMIRSQFRDQYGADINELAERAENGEGTAEEKELMALLKSILGE